MKKLILFSFIVASTLSVFAQNSTTGEDPIIAKDAKKQSVLIVPFETKMYISDIDRDLAVKNELSYQDIKAKFRAGLDQNLFLTLKPYYNVLSFYTLEPQEAIKELSYIYNSIGYKYEVMPKEEVVEEKNIGKKLLNKFKKKEKEEEYIDAGIRNGQVVSQVDNREKYMKTTLSNDNLISMLNKRYQAQYYVFINQLDIKRGANSMYSAAEDKYKREIKVHYTIFDDKGNEVSTGAIKKYCSTTQNDINKIIKTQFPLITQQLLSNLVATESTETEQ